MTRRALEGSRGKTEAAAGPSWGAIALAALGLFYLNSLLTFQNVWPTPWVRLVPELAIEILLLLGALGLWRLAGFRLGAWPKAALCGLIFAAFVLRYIEVTAPPLFGRGLNLYWDVQHLPNLIALFWRAAGLPRAVLAAVGFLVGTGGLLWLIWLALGWLDRPLGRRCNRLAAVLCGVVAAAVFFGAMAADRSPLRRAFAIPATVIAGKHIGFVSEALRLRGADAATIADRFALTETASSDLAGLEGDPVFIVFLESYGTTAIDDPRHRPAVLAALDDLQARLRTAGWHGLSNRLVSPTFGGGSWWAHATLLSGARLTDQTLYSLFVTTDRETLVSRFNDAGYRSVAVQPGIQRQWPEGAFFRFDKIYDAEGLGYPGPDFGFWRIPDQYTLHRFATEELSRDGPPLFALIALIMSHMPFQPLPPYVADWSRLDAGQAYDPEATRRLVAQEADWSDLSRSYVEALRYSFRILGDFILDRLPQNALVVVIGDHQPPALLTGEGKPWTVPIHLLSRNPARLAPFRAYGYRPGLIPDSTGTRGMETFFADFLHAYDSASSTQAER